MEKMKPTSITIALGTVEVAQKRRAAYDAQAKALGVKTSTWIRNLADAEIQRSGAVEDQHAE